MTEYAQYLNGSGTNRLVFQYVVQPGDNRPALDYASTTPIVLNGGSILDSSGNPVNLVLPATGATGSLSATETLEISGAESGGDLDQLREQPAFPRRNKPAIQREFQRAGNRRQRRRFCFDRRQLGRHDFIGHRRRIELHGDRDRRFRQRHTGSEPRR